MTPAFTFGAISKAKLIFSDQILAASPYGVLLAMDTASLGVLNAVSYTHLTLPTNDQV